MASIDFTFRPLVTWPGPQTKARRQAPFRVSTDRTLHDLRRELAHLAARSVVVQVAVNESDIRVDGWIRADRRPRHPGVILSFESKHGPLSYPCDTYLELWDNVRAISLAMTALRAVDRYGVTRRGEQYSGWKALPGPAPAPPMTERDAAACLADRSELLVVQILDDIDTARKAYRIACMRTHPDRGGTVEAFTRVQSAAAVLARHHHVETL